MKTVVLTLSVLSSLLLSCKAQQTKVKIQIFNRSAVSIDSINISHTPLKIKEKIKTNEAKTIEANLPTVSSSEEGPLLIFIFQGSRLFKASWGFCDVGICVPNNKPVYVFDNGINYIDEAPKMPKEFVLYVTNMTNNSIDSIFSESGAIIRKSDLSKNTKEIVLDFLKFKENPILIIQSDRQFKADINFHDWSDWNNNQAAVFLYEDGVFNKEK